MPSIRYINQSAPFWDFIASLEDQGTSHPFFGGNMPHRNGPTRNQDAGPSSADEKRGTNMDDGSDSETATLRTPGTEAGEKDFSGKEKVRDDNDNDNDKDKDGKDGKHCGRDGARGGCGRGGRRFQRSGGGPCGGGRRGAWGRGPWWAAHGGMPGGMPGAFPFGGPSGPGGPGGSGGPFNPLAHLASFFEGPGNADRSGGDNNSAAQDFRPRTDVFDTPASFVLHLSLPGAKKEDVGVHWDADKSEIVISGVVHRPGVDEEMLAQLAMGERAGVDVGAFERRVRLGTRASPAKVVEEDIRAKLEDGILVVELPKEGKQQQEEEEEFVEVRKVDVE